MNYLIIQDDTRPETYRPPYPCITMLTDEQLMDLRHELVKRVVDDPEVSKDSRRSASALVNLIDQWETS